MDSKFYVSYEAARLLKEKGYNRDINNYYDENGFLHYLEYDENYDYVQMSNNDLDLDHYAAPTKDEAIDWLEGKGIIIELSVTVDLCHWVFSIYMKGREGILSNTDLDVESLPTRLEAKEAAIIKALECL